MKKILLAVLSCIFIASAGSCFADQVYYIEGASYKPTLLDKIEDSTQDFAETVGDATVNAADKTGKAIKKGAKATGKAFAKGAKEAGHATKKGAKKATNWSAKKIRSGAEKIIIKTEDTTVTTPETIKTEE